MTARLTKPVGYKSPPVDHQFKPGHKPKRRALRPEESIPELLSRLLNEGRPVEYEGKRRRMSKLQIIVQKLLEGSERGNQRLQKVMDRYLPKAEIEEMGPRVFVDGVEVARWPAEPPSS
jgi:hypothetical protein